MEREKKEKKPRYSSAAFKTGAVSLVFLLIGYQAALFIHKASVLRIESLRDHPDTVYVVDEAVAASLLRDAPGMQKAEGGTGPGEHDAEGGGGAYSGGRTSSGSGMVIRSEGAHSAKVQDVRRATRKVENFRFDPNTVSLDELERLGFSEKQAQSIINYREKGGHFRRKSDFARSYVVADSVYRRLEPFIDIPLTDINRADSAAFDALPGIGGYFAAKMVSFRTELGGYSHQEQLLDIWNFGEERYEALKDLICCSKGTPYALWSLPAEELRKHPYIRDWQTARAIVLYRENTPREDWTVEKMKAAGVLPAEKADKLARCLIAE